jgi:hypothetical protein
VALVIAFGVVRIASTHRVFSEVLDEPAHISCGYDWLKGAPYAIDPTHPPLERALSALPALFQRVPLSKDPNFVARGNEILYFHDDYAHNLAAARRGNLLFFILGAVSVAWWGWRTFGRVTALIATAFFSFLPPILGHAGVATTDMAAAAGVTFAIVVLGWWLDAPSLRRSIALGAAIGIGLLTKFSFLFFFPIAALIVIVLRRRRDAPDSRAATHPGPSLTLPMTSKMSSDSLRPAKNAIRGEGLANPRSRPGRLGVTSAAIAIFIVWAGYRFDFGTIKSAHEAGEWVAAESAPKFLRPVAVWFADHVPIPAPLFVVGAEMVKIHDREGHFTYLFGHVNQHGWWYYFPVVFFFKTPLPFLILALIGIASAKRRGLAAALIPIALMLAVLPSSINIGVRHILPIYPPLCILAAHGAIVLWQRATLRAVAIALAAWMLIGVERAHPDYLPWFNEAAGGHPERIVVDSNLDWGQDVLRLASTAKKLHIDRMWILYTGNALLERHGLVADEIRPWLPAPGWYVLSETGLALNGDARRGAYRWLDDYRMRRVGKSMRLYHVPEMQGAGDR